MVYHTVRFPGVLMLVHGTTGWDHLLPYHLLEESLARLDSSSV